MQHPLHAETRLGQILDIRTDWNTATMLQLKHSDTGQVQRKNWKKLPVAKS